MRIFHSVQIEKYCGGDAALLEDGEAAVRGVGEEPGCAKGNDALGGRG